MFFKKWLCTLVARACCIRKPTCNTPACITDGSDVCPDPPIVCPHPVQIITSGSRIHATIDTHYTVVGWSASGLSFIQPNEITPIVELTSSVEFKGPVTLTVINQAGDQFVTTRCILVTVAPR